MIRNGDFLLSQSIVCMGYLSEKFGIRPLKNEDHARAQMIANNCNDIITELYENRAKTKQEFFDYLSGRFQAWLDLFEKPLKKNNLKFYFDDKCTQADLALFNFMDGIEELFGNDSYNKYVKTTHSYLDKYYQELKNRESISRLMNKQKGMYSYIPAFGWNKTRKILRGQDTDIVSTFKSDEIIPDVVDNEPLELLTMEYKLHNFTFKLDEMGKILTPRQVQDCPFNLQFKGCDTNKLYTIILTDPDARDRKEHKYREWVHFLKINVSGSDLTNSGDSIIEYVGSGPPSETGLHRYVWLVFEQSHGKIDIDKCGQKKLCSGGGGFTDRRSWKARKFVNDNNLGPLVAGIYYCAEYDDFVPKLGAWLLNKGTYKSRFKNDEIIPDVIDDEPLELLTMEYKIDDEINKLNEMATTLTPTQVQNMPYNLKFNRCDPNKLYTIILTDPDARDRIKHEFREWVHFVKINVNGNDLDNSGDIIIEYVGSGPPQSSGLHRYVWLVYEQSQGKIDIDKCGQKKLAAAGTNGKGRPKWKAREFIKNNKLGPLVAGTFYNAEYDDYVPTLYAWLAGEK